MNRFRFSAVFILVLTAVPLFAGGEAEIEGGGNRVAICIGVSMYGSSQPLIPAAGRDAVALRSFLVSEAGFPDATLYADLPFSGGDEPTRSAILDRLRSIRDASAKQPLEDVLLFFSGYGVTSNATESKSYLLLGAMEAATMATHIDIEHDLLPILTEIRCERMFILLDTCRSKGLTEIAEDPEGYHRGVDTFPISREESAATEAVYVVYASRQDTPSIEIPQSTGVFTSALIDGMRMYRNFYDLLVFLDRSVPVRSFSYAADSEQTRVPQFLDFGGDFDLLRAGGYPSFADLTSTTTRVAASRGDRTALSRSIGATTFSVGVGLCAASAANLAVLSTMDSYIRDTSIQRAKNVSWTLLGASALLIVPSIILSFVGL